MDLPLFPNKAARSRRLCCHCVGERVGGGVRSGEASPLGEMDSGTKRDDWGAKEAGETNPGGVGPTQEEASTGTGRRLRRRSPGRRRRALLRRSAWVRRQVVGTNELALTARQPQRGAIPRVYRPAPRDKTCVVWRRTTTAIRNSPRAGRLNSSREALNIAEKSGEVAVGASAEASRRR